MKKLNILICTLLVICSQMAFGQVAQKLSYQGMLTDAQGNPVPDGTVDLTCRLYKDASGGSSLWEETQQVAIIGGVFSAILGSSTQLNLPFDKAYWLGLSVNGDSELEPRTALTASAYSLFAESIADNSVSGKKIKDDAITGEKIADGHIVRSVNSITDDVTLVEGNNIDITKNGSKLTISATGGGGLTEVETNSSLSGKGTSNSPLQIAIPLDLTGSSSIGVVHGTHTNGNNGHFAGATYGVYGQHNNNNRGWLGQKDGGVFGFSSNGNYGYIGTSTEGVYGKHKDGNEGWLGHDLGGVYAQHSNGNSGSLAGVVIGVQGYNKNGNWGYIGGSDKAGYFGGNVQITGSLTKGGGSFQIDHPLDPANKYLLHSFVESPDMMNVYNGNVVLDSNGEAVVELPHYFDALNRDFRYQLTAIGAPAPDLYIAEKISGNLCKIAGGKPGMEVSWQVTGIRQDKWANENRIVVEEDKAVKERGFYLHPELYGLTVERSVEWARDPEGMAEMTQGRKKLLNSPTQKEN